MDVVSRSEPSIRHLHDSAFGVRGRHPCLGLLLPVVRFLSLFRFIHLLDSLFDPLLAVRRCAFARARFSSSSRRRIAPDLPRKRFHLLVDDHFELLESLPSPHRSRSGPRSHFHSVLSNPLHLHQPAIDQDRHRLLEQPLEHVRRKTPKIRQRVVVHAHSTAHPLVGDVQTAQPFELSRRTYSVRRRHDPQSQKNARVRRWSSRASFPRLDPSQEITHVEPFHERPDRSRLMVRRKPLLKIHHHQPRLLPVRFYDARLTLLLRHSRIVRAHPLFHSTPISSQPLSRRSAAKDLK